MIKRHFKTNIIFLLVTIILLSSCIAFADMGPKPSIIINVHGMEGQYYATLLSKSDRIGPWYVGNSFEDVKGWGDNYTQDAWDILKAFNDSDDFYFVGFMDVCNGEDSFSWTYMRPEVFKVLLYDCSAKTYYCSKIIESYAFNSEYDVVCSNTAGGLVSELQVSKAHDTNEKLLAIAFRIIATILIELVVAFLFNIRTKKQIGCICVVNLVTQILLNLVLPYPAILFSYIIKYGFIEILIIVIEAILYSMPFGKHFASISKKKIYGYSTIANIFSFALGYVISLQFPFLFK